MQDSPEIKKLHAGFTIVEMLVSLSIVSMIMSTVLFNYSGFNDSLALNSAGREMAVAIRQAQTYGLTVKETAAGGGQFTAGYGIYFNPTDNPTTYLIFVDTNGNKKYDVGSGCGSGSTECIEGFTLRNGVRITGICDGNDACPPQLTVRSLSVSFLRPNPDASILFIDNGGGTAVGPSLTGKVVLTSPKGSTIKVTIESTGQVFVQ